MTALKSSDLINGFDAKESKIEAMWIGSAKNNKTKPLGFQSYQEPIKSLGAHLLYNQGADDSLNFTKWVPN